MKFTLQRLHNKRIGGAFATFVLVLATISTLIVPKASAADTWCGFGTTSGLTNWVPGGETCATVFHYDRGNWMDTGDAQWNLAYRYLAGTGYDTGTDSRRRLGILGQPINGYSSPTVYTHSEGQYAVYAVIDWDFPSIRKACRWSAHMIGGNVNFGVSATPQVSCFAY
jgi:hypothetical protein